MAREVAHGEEQGPAADVYRKNVSERLSWLMTLP
jgi:hypothetical protein